MSEERIYASPTTGVYVTSPGGYVGLVEYVRADLYAALEQERGVWRVLADETGDLTAKAHAAIQAAMKPCPNCERLLDAAALIASDLELAMTHIANARDEARRGLPQGELIE